MSVRIISQHPDSRGRELRQYPLDGIPTVGVFGSEPYSIEVSNPYRENILVMIAVDGTNVLTGQKAVLDPHSHDVFVLQAGRSMKLDAWPEDRQGGGRFVFTSVEGSVALHTHGDLTAKGYISVAVIREGYVPPRLSPRLPHPWENEVLYRGGGNNVMYDLGGPATGVGERVAQQIGTATGLIQPEYHGELWQVRYLWWDDVKAKLEAAGIQPTPQHPTGFVEKMADLGTTPRIVVGGEHDRRNRRTVPAHQPNYSRFV